MRTRSKQRPAPHIALLCALFLMSVLPGCAAYRKCGFGGCRGDAEITANVQALLSQYPALEGSNQVRVQTLDHVVYLTGLVDTPFEQRLAESIARRAPGLTRVVNTIGLINQGL